MSFALEYRKKLQVQQNEALTVRKANEGFVSMPAEASTDTRNNRRRVFLGLVLAGGTILGGVLGAHLTVLKGDRWLRRVVTATVIVFAVKLWLSA